MKLVGIYLTVDDLTALKLYGTKLKLLVALSFTTFRKHCQNNQCRLLRTHKSS